MYDYVIRNGQVVDGTGSPARAADIGIEDGTIVAVGDVEGTGTTEFDATGLVVAPGIIDPHTHYDAQLFWDPTASPSNLHGVTTVIGGNCGFTLAPIKSEDHDYIRRMMAKVEGMPLVALENGLPWDWTSFGEYLGKLEGNLGVNAGFLTATVTPSPPAMPIAARCWRSVRWCATTPAPPSSTSPTAASTRSPTRRST